MGNQKTLARKPAKAQGKKTIAASSKNTAPVSPMKAPIVKKKAPPARPGRATAKTTALGLNKKT